MAEPYGATGEDKRWGIPPLFHSAHGIGGHWSFIFESLHTNCERQPDVLEQRYPQTQWKLFMPPFSLSIRIWPYSCGVQNRNHFQDPPVSPPLLAAATWPSWKPYGWGVSKVHGAVQLIGCSDLGGSCGPTHTLLAIRCIKSAQFLPSCCFCTQGTCPFRPTLVTSLVLPSHSCAPQMALPQALKTIVLVPKWCSSISPPPFWPSHECMEWGQRELGRSPVPIPLPTSPTHTLGKRLQFCTHIDFYSSEIETLTDQWIFHCMERDWCTYSYIFLYELCTETMQMFSQGICQHLVPLIPTWGQQLFKEAYCCIQGPLSASFVFIIANAKSSLITLTLIHNSPLYDICKEVLIV